MKYIIKILNDDLEFVGKPLIVESNLTVAKGNFINIDKTQYKVLEMIQYLKADCVELIVEKRFKYQKKYVSTT